ncbi:MAG: hypothetical protein AAFY60_06815 [Myxococcota bacterium]
MQADGQTHLTLLEINGEFGVSEAHTKGCIKAVFNVAHAARDDWAGGGFKKKRRGLSNSAGDERLRAVASPGDFTLAEQENTS